MQNQIINYVDYKHSYAHSLAPRLKQLNYVANVQKDYWHTFNIIKKTLNNGEVIWTDKEFEFFDDIKNCQNSTAMYFRTKNAIECAKNIYVEVDVDGNLIK